MVKCDGTSGIKLGYTLHREGGKALVLSSLIDHLAGVFSAVPCFTDRYPKSGNIVLKCPLNLWILQNPVVIFLPLNR